MLTEALFNEVLLNPAQTSADTLRIVSGYASATMVSRHLEILQQVRKKVRIELIVGMAVQDGLSSKDHQSFQSLASSSDHKDLFECRYVAYRPPVHSKVYVWHSNGEPTIAFIGSANYTQPAFRTSRREAMVKGDPNEATAYFDLIRQDTIDCLDQQVEDLISVYEEPAYSIGMSVEDEADSDGFTDQAREFIASLPHVTVSFLARDGTLPQRSGLNWGQRPELRRNPNQAYIRLPNPIARSNFFPPRGDHFTIITDDDKSLICARAQDNGKAIHTSDSNSKMGIYFRNRLGLAGGSMITRQHLDAYGRTNVDFYKIDEETFYMDFSADG